MIGSNISMKMLVMTSLLLFASAAGYVSSSKTSPKNSVLDPSRGDLDIQKDTKEPSGGRIITNRRQPGITNNVIHSSGSFRQMLGSFASYLPDFETGYRALDYTLQGVSVVGLFTLAYALYVVLYPSVTTTGRSVSSGGGRRGPGSKIDFVQILNTIEEFDIEKLAGRYLDVSDVRCKKRVACELRYNMAKYPTVKLMLQILLGLQGKSLELVPENLQECVRSHSDCTTSLSDVILRKTMKAMGRK